MAFGFSAFGHKSSDSYLRVRVTGDVVSGAWYLALHDLEFAIGLDANEDGAITWGELKARKAHVIEYGRSRLDIDWDDRGLEAEFEPEVQVDQLANGGYVVLRWEGRMPGGGRVLEIGNRVFFDSNPLHRGLLVVEQGEQVHQAIFNPKETRLRFELDFPRPWQSFVTFLREGVHHIWMGYDHILFLLVLLLPSVLRREAGAWVAEEGLGRVFWNVVKVVTSFTIAHSITLSVAALDWVRAPSRIVELVIAASILVAALNNIRPLVTGRIWAIAFGFGLIHGFGFASVLQDLGLPRANLFQALAGFNLGVELGQLAIVVVFLPIAYGLRHVAAYRAWGLAAGSWMAAGLAALWICQRW